jgi:hypothetical protein
MCARDTRPLRAESVIMTILSLPKDQSRRIDSNRVGGAHTPFRHRVRPTYCAYLGLYLSFQILSQKIVSTCSIPNLSVREGRHKRKRVQDPRQRY